MVFENPILLAQQHGECIMFTSTPVLSIAAFVVLIAGLAALRIYSAGRITIEVKEIVAAIAVVGLGLFMLGEVTEVAFGDVKLVRRVKQAQDERVKSRIPDTASTVVVEEQRIDDKGGPGAIPSLIDSQVTALSFSLGGDYYVPKYVAQYLLDLTEAPYLRYVVFNDDQGRFAGIADARAIATAFRVGSEVLTSELLTQWIKTNNVEALRTLPGFVGVDRAVQDLATTREALDLMVQQHAAWLPVIDASGSFKGIVHQDKLVLAILDALTGG
jgi:CBS domain-containing protein